VPAGQRIRIEHVSALCLTTPPGISFVSAGVKVVGVANAYAHELVPTFLGGTAGYTVASTPMRFDAGPGDAIIGGSGTLTGSASVFCTVTMSGRSFAVH
jgi:hypothetical protein